MFISLNSTFGRHPVVCLIRIKTIGWGGSAFCGVPCFIYFYCCNCTITKRICLMAEVPQKTCVIIQEPEKE